jgi:hypothetical protein
MNSHMNIGGQLRAQQLDRGSQRFMVYRNSELHPRSSVVGPTMLLSRRQHCSTTAYCTIHYFKILGEPRSLQTIRSGIQYNNSSSIPMHAWYVGLPRRVGCGSGYCILRQNTTALQPQGTFPDHLAGSWLPPGCGDTPSTGRTHKTVRLSCLLHLFESRSDRGQVISVQGS